MSAFRITLVIVALLGLTLLTTAATAAEPKRALIIHSYPPGFEGGFAEQLRAQLDKQLPGKLEVQESWLGAARLTSRGDDPAFVDYLNSLFIDRPIDLVIAIGSPAAKFLQRYRQELFPSTPELLTFVEQHAAANLKADQVTVPYAQRDKTSIDNILRMLPDTRSLVIVTGHSPIERQSLEDLTASAQAFRGRLSIVPLNGVRTFGQLLKRVSTLPPHSVIYYELFFPDIDGTPADEYTALRKVHAAADAPIFSVMGEYYGEGIVGGPMILYDDYARLTANVAGRILSGEPLSHIKVPPIHLSAPKFDGRELARWGIDEHLLPPDSEIDYLKPGVWQQYRWEILAAASLIILQALLILSLLYEHRRRRNAEIAAHRRLLELARMNRRATAGQLSVSIAHEINQPLAAILANTEAAEATSPSAPTAQDLRELIKDIKHDALRASEVIKRLRRLLADVPSEPQNIDLNDVIRETFEFLSAQALSRRAALSTDLAVLAPQVLGDRIQLQQIILNLVLNALDAMGSIKAQERRIVAHTRLLDDTWAEVSIEDNGPGIPDESLEQIFDPFFTTKEDGMGMGLSIARAIVQSHGGRIWADNCNGGGAVFKFTLRLSKRHARPTKPLSSVVPFRSALEGGRRQSAHVAQKILPLNKE